MSDAWKPDQYERFGDERAKPFFDLLDLVAPVPGGRIVDLGCGPGTLTVHLNERLGASLVVGIDSSVAMLSAASAAGRAVPGSVEFRAGDLATFAGLAEPDGGACVGDGRVDVVVANASLHWVPEHREVLSRWIGALAPGGQVAVQVPANPDHPSHTVAVEVAAEMAVDPEWADAFAPCPANPAGGPPPDPVARNVADPATYATWLYELGCVEQHVRLQVYGHVLADTEEVVEWVKGTSLTRFASALAARPDAYDELVRRYRIRLPERLGRQTPYFYPFKRILFWGRLP